MRVDQLRYLLRIIEIGSFRRSAEELHVSQPTLSASLKALEKELGAQLMERGRSGVRLTQIGEEVIPYIRSIVEGEAALKSEVDAHRGLRRGLVRIGATNAGANTLLPAVLRSFHDRYPGVQLQVSEAGSLSIEQHVNEGKFDIGLVVARGNGSLSSGILGQTLLSGPLVVCVPSDHPFTKMQSVTADDVAKQPLILLPPGYFMHSLALELFGEQALNLVFYSDNTASIKKMIASGIGITVLPEFSVSTDLVAPGGHISSVPLDSPYSAVRLEIIRRQRSYASHAIRELWSDLVAEANTVGAALDQSGS